MKRRYKYSIVAILLFLLVLVRAFEKQLFYDPFLLFFKNNYLYAEMPVFDFTRLLVNLLYRFSLNTVFSIGIIYVVFEKKSYAWLALKLYAIAFVVFTLLYTYFLYTAFEIGYLLPFYVRRFLIHPLLLLLLVAAFYYRNGVKRD